MTELVRHMPLLQLVYASRPFGFDAGTLINILFKARSKNAAADVTGCLICRDDIYLQMLEGPAEDVARIYEKIVQDDRHVEVTELVRHEVTDRMFGKWAMRDDPVQSWMWTREEVDRGDVSRASKDDVLRVFNKLAAQPSEPT